MKFYSFKQLHNLWIQIIYVTTLSLFPGILLMTFDVSIWQLSFWQWLFWWSYLQPKSGRFYFKAEIRGCAKYLPKAIYVNNLSYIPIVYVKMRNIWEKIMGTNFSYWECEDDFFAEKHSNQFCCVHTILTLENINRVNLQMLVFGSGYSLWIP